MDKPAMAEAIVMYSSPIISHIKPFVALAKFILSTRPSLSIHILLPPHRSYSDHTSSAVNSYVAAISAALPSVKFHHLAPEIRLPNDVPAANELVDGFRALLRNNPLVRQALVDISQTCTILAFIIDFFCTCALPVSSEINIPTYFYFTSSAGCLAFFIYMTTIHYSDTKSLMEMDKMLLKVPGIPPLPAKDSPGPLLNRHGETYSYFFEFSENIPNSSGILVNTFEALEGSTLKAIREGLCLPKQATPPLFCTGPLIAIEDQKNADSLPQEECLRWLHRQPSKSVVYLAFGSLGTFSTKQLSEIAIGLERSGQRFLWVVQIPPTELEDHVESLLPKGFMERIGERGFLVKSWAPQVAILEHPAVGGYVTHCGWNSILEAVRAGVPMVAWPRYAEQKLNRVLLVEEMKLATWMKEEADGFVGWEEVEKRVIEILSDEVGDVLRERCGAMKAVAQAALMPGGSSVEDLERFLTSLSPP